MIRNLVILEPYVHLYYRDGLVIATKQKKVLEEAPIKFLKTIQFYSTGGSISGKLIQECALRGIHLFFTDYRNYPVSMLYGTNQHKLARLRKKQFELPFEESFLLMREIIYGKVRNQRVLILFLFKNRDLNEVKLVERKLLEIANTIRNISFSYVWKNQIMGLEGMAAQLYWNFLRRHFFAGLGFIERHHKHNDIINSSLNLGYTVLLHQVWRAVSIAGLEPFFGYLHAERINKPSLVLDIMEEYRPWVVDRVIVKLVSHLRKKEKLEKEEKKLIISEILNTFQRTYTYEKKKYKLETIIQKQVYKICGFISDRRMYKPFIFEW